MLFNDALLFVHVPKTAGESIARFLVDNLPGRKTLVDEFEGPYSPILLPASVRAKLRIKSLLRRWRIGVPPAVTLLEGKRHARLSEARDILAQLRRRLEDFRAIVAVVRNPYDLEVSRYHYLRLGYHGVPGVARSREQKIAIERDFEQFALKAPYHGRLPAGIEDWYQVDGRVPCNLRIVRFENLKTDLHRAIGEFCPVDGDLPKLNATKHEPYPTHLSPAAEEAIYRKYRWLFDRRFYTREFA